MSVSCGYRIYPAWFSGASTKPMRELADNAASRMGRRVESIAVTRNGEDWRGVFIDFKVTYTSTVERPWMERST